MSRLVVLVLALLGVTQISSLSHAQNCSCVASSCACAKQSCCDCILCREELTGDWCGKRTCLADNGLVIESFLTQFYQGVASGGFEQEFLYGSKFDLYLEADTGKMGLWEGGKLAVHAADWNFGENIIFDAAGLAPANLLLLTPDPEASFGLTHLLYEHELGGGYQALAGRVNMVDLWTAYYPDFGRGRDGFMNASALLPLSVVPSLPLIANAAGINKVGDRGVLASFMVFETQHIPTTVGLDFPNGVSFLGALRKYTDFGGLPGSHTFVGTYATGEFTSFDTEGWIIDPLDGINPPAKDGTWAALYVGEQRLWQDPCNENRYTKLFGYLGFSEPANSPFRWTASISVEKFGPLGTRPHDRTGIGYFYNALNSDFQNAYSLINPVDDVQGGEVYYNAAITPWFGLTADLQVLRPASVAEDTALVLGLRARIIF